ncbi:MAG: hypothetical protein MUC93_10470 [Bacteroidales bacterium]|jgi:hypothetical protein|nr:hypothetical protein [Bacteroidales bacterium]
MKSLKRVSGLIIITILIILLYSCKKEEPPSVNQPLVFNQLVAEKNMIHPGESTTITATASGDQLFYTWKATAGDILGSGNRVTYISPPCTIGSNEITCSISDKANNSLTKKIVIEVY